MKVKWGYQGFNGSEGGTNARLTLHSTAKRRWPDRIATTKKVFLTEPRHFLNGCSKVRKALAKRLILCLLIGVITPTPVAIICNVFAARQLDQSYLSAFISPAPAYNIQVSRVFMFAFGSVRYTVVSRLAMLMSEQVSLSRGISEPTIWPGDGIDQTYVRESVIPQLLAENKRSSILVIVRSGFPFYQFHGFIAPVEAVTSDGKSLQLLGFIHKGIVPLAEMSNSRGEASMLLSRPIALNVSWAGFVGNILSWSTAIVIAMLLFDYSNRAIRIRNGRCATCGYPLGSVVCPECGTKAKSE